MTSDKKGQASVTGGGARPRTAWLAKLAGRLLSDDPLIRALAVQSALAAFGIGTFMTGSAVYFTRIVGLSVPQVGLGLTAGIAVQFLISVPLGRVVDRFGALRCWVGSSVLEAAVFLAWFEVHSFWGYLAVSIGVEAFSTLGNLARGAYRLGAFPPDQRVRSSAYSRAALNVGFTLGALAGGIALATGTLTAVRLIPLVSLIIMAANAVMVGRLPKVAPQAAPTTAATPATDAATGSAPVGGSVAEASPAIAGRPASRNVGFFLTSFFDGILGTHQVLLLTVIPLWLVADTNSPHVLLAWLFATNTVLAVLFQVRVSHVVTSVRTALRAEYVAAAFMVASCVIILATDHTIIWLTIPLVWLAHMTVTGAELFESSAQWGLQAELSDQRRLGDYQGIANLGNAVGTVWAPAAYTYLATDWHTTGWLLIAAIIIVAAVAIRPATRLAERFLAAETAVSAGPTAGSVPEHAAEQVGVTPA